MVFSFTQLLFLFVLAGLALATIWHAFFISNRMPNASQRPSAAQGNARFLFRAGELIDANATALKICAEFPSPAFDWSDLNQYLSARFPEFPRAQGSLHQRDVTVLQSQDPSDASILTLDQWDDVARVTLKQDDTPDVIRRTAILQAMFQAPNPVWKSDADGMAVWRNAAYKDLVAHLGYSPKLRRLFDVTNLLPGDPPKRLCVSSQNGTKDRWFDVTAVQAGSNVMYYATEADALVSALDAQRSFVRILSKTFAHLAIGLAIFDRDRQLILFNPALSKMTDLGADFLSNRCDLYTFFDQLRERHIMPASISQTNWRTQINTVITASKEGRYCETWTLPSGATYRITGRPHPDGSLAFLFEDITSEIKLTRKFRTEIENCHNVIDTIESALALFANSGQLTLCNQAYRQLWKSDPDSSFADYTLHDAIGHWQEDCMPSSIWSELSQHVFATVDRKRWEAVITLKSRALLKVKVIPITGGLTVVSFDKAPSGPNMQNTSHLTL